MILAWLLAALTGCMAQPVMESELSYRRFTTQDGLPQMQTETVWQDSRGYIYIGTLSGFARYDGTSLTPFLGGRRENIVGFQEVDGQLRAMGFVRQWLVSGNEAVKAQIDPEDKLLLNNFNAADLPPGYVLLEDRQEQNRVLCRLEGGACRQVLASPLLDEMTPDRKMYVDSALTYVPTPQGLYVLDAQGSSRRLTARGDVFSLVRTSDGLFALAADGIYEVRADSLALRFAFRFEAPDYGLYVRPYRQHQLVIADAHTIWLYDDRADGSLRCLTTGYNLIKGIFVDRWQRLWAATYQGVYCFFHCNFTDHRLTDKNDIVRAMAFSHDGRLVMGTLNGKVISDRRQVSAIDGNFYAPSAVCLNDQVYMPGNGDIAAVQGDSLRWLGLPYDRYQFVSRYADRLVIGTRNSVVSYAPADGHVDTLTTEIVRPWCAAGDGEGRLWVSGLQGLYCLTGITDGKVRVRQVRGTPTTLVITAMATDGRGRVCFALGDSLFAISNGEVTTMTETLPTLKGHEIRSLHLSPRGYLVVAAIDGMLACRIDSGGRAEDIHWFDASNGFTMIEPLAAPLAESADGTVWMAGLEGMTSFDPAALLADNHVSTVVPAPRLWWQRWWVWLLAASLLSLVVWMVARHFEHRRAHRKMEVLKGEKKQKELLLNAVRLKAIPHFHANVLASIEYFVMNHSTDEAIHYMKLYSNFTNQTIADIDRPSRSVAEEVNYVRAYLELERLRYGERLQFFITVAPDVDQNTMLPTMLLHTYCQNAVKHGISAKHGTGTVRVEVSRQQREGVDGILVAVSDDGIGRQEAAHTSGQSTKQGLKILEQQIELYNSANRHQIVQSVADLTDDDGRPAGTCFQTWVPSDYRF